MGLKPTLQCFADTRLGRLATGSSGRIPRPYFSPTPKDRLSKYFGLLCILSGLNETYLVRTTGLQPVRISPNGFKPFASGYSAKPACPLSGLKLTSNVGKENRQDNIRSPISEGQSAEMPHISRVNMQSAPRASYSFAGVTKRQCWRRVSAKRSYFLGRVSRLSFSSV